MSQRGTTRKGARNPHFLPDLRTRLLNLPPHLRAKIWRTLGYSHTRTLRLVCSTIKEDIDKRVGISSAIDSTFEDFSFHSSVAIRKLSIHELIKPAYVEFLKFPLILEELEIRGEISLKNFNYIIKSCPNITILHIVFNKYVLEYGTKMFPLPDDTRNAQPLTKVHSIKLVATTRKISEISYVHRNVTNLLKEPCLENNRIKSLHVLVAHRTASKMLKELMAETLHFIHKHLSTMVYLNLNFRDKDPTASTAASGEASPSGSTTEIKNDEAGGENPKPVVTPPAKPKRLSTPKKKSSDVMSTSTTPIKPPQKRKSLVKDKQEPAAVAKTPDPVKETPAQTTPEGGGGGARKASIDRAKDVHQFDPGAVAEGASQADDISPLDIPPEVEGEANVLPPSQAEVTTAEEANDAISIALKTLSDLTWPRTEKLHYLILAVPLRVLEGLIDMIHKDTLLYSLNLEGYGGSHQNWPVYMEFVKRSNPYYLEQATFHHVNHTNSKGKSIPIDLKIFRDNKGLKRLTLLGDKKDDFSTLSRAAHISSLPSSLDEVMIERVLLTHWQAFRLIYCFPDMMSVTLEYWSISDSQFAKFITLLKWALKCDCTSVKKITLVETKIRFNNKRKAVRSLQEALAVSTAYTDTIDTRLLVDITASKDSKLIAPTMQIEKITPPQPKPPRKKDKEKDSKQPTAAEKS